MDVMAGREGLAKRGYRLGVWEVYEQGGVKEARAGREGMGDGCKYESGKYGREREG